MEYWSDRAEASRIVLHDRVLSKLSEYDKGVFVGFARERVKVIDQMVA